MLSLPSDPIRARHHGKTPHTRIHTHTDTHSYTYKFTTNNHQPLFSPTVSYPPTLLELLLCGGPRQLSGPWNKQAANVGRQDRQLEAHRQMHRESVRAALCSLGVHTGHRKDTWKDNYVKNKTLTSPDAAKPPAFSIFRLFLAII